MELESTNCSTTQLEFIKTDIMPLLLKHKSRELVNRAVERSKKSNPMYYDIVKKPMCIETLNRKLKNYEYKNSEQFFLDASLMFHNWYNLYKKGSSVHKRVEELELIVCEQVHYLPEERQKSFLSKNSKRAKKRKSILPSSNTHTIKFSEKQQKFASKLLEEFTLEENKVWFREFLNPVDTAFFNDYLDVVKSPMDLRTMSEKLQAGLYKSPEDFAADMKLIVSNCKKYNKGNPPMLRAGKKLEGFFNSRWVNLPTYNVEAVSDLSSSQNLSDYTTDNDHDEAVKSYKGYDSDDYEQRIKKFQRKINSYSKKLRKSKQAYESYKNNKKSKSSNDDGNSEHDVNSYVETDRSNESEPEENYEGASESEADHHVKNTSDSSYIQLSDSDSD